ncbi:Helix-turn-helix domain protein [Falsiruegeria litorea R37]|uniref:Helix-turn-helix domain protein n=1 Tax=Falsiruegeria litorea R37 TaxID=1200284 RepID=A0A1Y5SNT2_9RHOB|nr:helix-turn-helix transcriptional regulator [Falsiruegeria litorea]SLN44378.1 Helix-turn-helix domain protein [Falsiruegeria litorea R37]
MADFGPALKEWRTTRRMSQMDLALSAGVSARHLSFLETGRARPSRGMVLRLCDELSVPNAGRNQLLTAAGMAPAYASRSPDAEDLKPLKEAVAWMLDNHAPYPAMALNRHWQLEEMNGPAAMMLSASGLQLGDSLIEALVSNEALRGALDNLEEVERHTLARLRTELTHFGRDPVIERAVEALQARVSRDDAVLPAVIPARYRMGDQLLSFFSTIAQFGTTGDLAMSELKVELMFPADDATRLALTGGV